MLGRDVGKGTTPSGGEVPWVATEGMAGMVVVNESRKLGELEAKADVPMLASLLGDGVMSLDVGVCAVLLHTGELHIRIGGKAGGREPLRKALWFDDLESLLSSAVAVVAAAVAKKRLLLTEGRSAQMHAQQNNGVYETFIVQGILELAFCLRKTGLSGFFFFCVFVCVVFPSCRNLCRGGESAQRK